MVVSRFTREKRIKRYVLARVGLDDLRRGKSAVATWDSNPKPSSP